MPARRDVDSPVGTVRYGTPSSLTLRVLRPTPPGIEVLDEVTFEEIGGTTLVTGRSAFPTFEARDLHLDGGAEQGLAECHEQLDELLRALLSRPRERQGP